MFSGLRPRFVELLALWLGVEACRVGLTQTGLRPINAHADYVYIYIYTYMYLYIYIYTYTCLHVMPEGRCASPTSPVRFKASEHRKTMKLTRNSPTATLAQSRFELTGIQFDC